MNSQEARELIRTLDTYVLHRVFCNCRVWSGRPCGYPDERIRLTVMEAVKERPELHTALHTLWGNQELRKVELTLAAAEGMVELAMNTQI